MQIKYLPKSHKGKKSRENEDSFIVPEKNEIMQKEPDTESKGYLFAVCDGMGGHKAGQVSSSLCCKWLLKEYYEEEKAIEPSAWMQDELESLNGRLYQLSNENDQYTGMGTTIVTLLVFEDRAFIHNVGDSRCYLYQNNSLKQITRDDSEVWELYENGVIDKQDIIKNSRKHIITQAIATEPAVNVHIYPVVSLTGDSLFMLCSDGLHDVMTDDQIKAILSQSAGLGDIADELINFALRKKSKDDITLILVSIKLN